MNPVLLIEDDPDIRTLVEHALRLNGIEVTSTAQGREGLSALESSAFSLVILDVMMPDMSGYEVLQQMAAMSRTDLPPVALFTAGPEEATAHEARSHGVSLVLPKPFEPNQLAKAVRSMMRE
jgi:DNA-binding response OmpR family regulator